MRTAPILAVFAVFAFLPAGTAVDPVRAAEDVSEKLFQDMSKAHITNVDTAEEKRQFMNTIAVEKMRIQNQMLRGTFDSALSLYRNGEFEGAQELAARILAIDPSFEDAALLREAATELKGAPRRWSSERRLLDDRFKQGLDLYQANRLVEAARKFEEVVKLSPAHLKARYWLKRAQGELAEIHYGRGAEAFESGQLQKALDHWYAALVLNPDYPKLMGQIQAAETEKRKRDANRLMQDAMTKVADGRTSEALEALDQVLQLDPGEERAASLIAEIKLEGANKHIQQGNKLYQARKFQEAIKEWRKAEPLGYDKEKIRKLVATAREMMKREKELQARREEEAKRRKEEEEEAAKKKVEREAKKKKEKEAELSFKVETGEGGEKKEKTEEEAGGEDRSVDGQKVVSAGGSHELSDVKKAEITEANRRQALQRYQAGMVFLQNRQYDKAKLELEQAKKLDPSNMEVDGALRRIDAIIAGQ